MRMKLSLDLLRFAFLLICSGCIPYTGAAEPGAQAQADGLSSMSEMSTVAVQEAIPELAATTQGEATGLAAENHDPPAAAEGFPRHNLNLLLRYTVEREHDGLTTGLEYEYRFRRWVGIGGMVEYIAGDVNVGVVGVMANFHPWRDLVLVIGPGVEFNSEENDLFLRMGALYEFKVGPVYLGPAVIFDTFIDRERALIVGGQVGVKF